MGDAIRFFFPPALAGVVAMGALAFLIEGGGLGALVHTQVLTHGFVVFVGVALANFLWPPMKTGGADTPY